MRRRNNRLGAKWQALMATAAVALLCLLSPSVARPEGAQAGDAASKQALDDFSARVNAYAKLRASLEETLPKLKPTDQPAKLADHDQALSAKVIDARKNAKQGDIFTKDISEQFRQRISEQLSGPQGRESRQTIRQGEPVELQVHVNQIYPAKLPRTTVPPTLLLKLPKLPKGIEYRIIGRTFALYDVKSHMIIDYIPGALPAQTPHA